MSEFAKDSEVLEAQEHTVLFVSLDGGHRIIDHRFFVPANHDQVGKFWELDEIRIFHRAFANDLQLLHGERSEFVVVCDGLSP